MLSYPSLLPLPLPAALAVARTIAAALTRVALSRFRGTRPPPGIPPPSDCTGRADAPFVFLLASFPLIRLLGCENDEKEEGCSNSLALCGTPGESDEEAEDDHTTLSLEALLNLLSFVLTLLASASVFEFARD